MKCVLWAVGAVLLTAWGPSLLAQAQPSPPKGLEVLSATVDRQSHQVTVQLHNSTNKTAVAYVLLVKAFDAEGNTLWESGFGTDFVNALDPNDTRGFIRAGQTGTDPDIREDPKVFTVQVSVMGVVYLDRTHEGVWETIFDARRKNAVAARQALALLKTNPATREETRQTIHELLAIDSTLVNGALANNLRLRAMPDFQHPPAESSFTKKQWDEVKGELTQRAEFFETLSQE